MDAPYKEATCTPPPPHHHHFKTLPSVHHARKSPLTIECLLEVMNRTVPSITDIIHNLPLPCPGSGGLEVQYKLTATELYQKKY